MTATTFKRKTRTTGRTLRAIFFLSFAVFPVLVLVGKAPARATGYVATDSAR